MMLWVGFLAFVLLMLALDLLVLNRRPHAVSGREAAVWTGVCIALALAFNVLVYFIYERDWPVLGASLGVSGREAAQQYFTGWLVEYSLSLDNIFVIALVFRYFKVAPGLQHRVLFWGILGALLMRGIMIFAGAAAIRRFEWVAYILGAFLVFWSTKMLLWGETDPDPERGWVVRIARRLFRISPARDDDHFFARVDTRFAITPLFLSLLVVEATDVVFAVDSIPAVLGITHDPFLVYTSNVFAVLGLRSAYFALAAFIDRFETLKPALAFVLGFVGLKMILGWWYELPTSATLGVIGLILLGGLARSVWTRHRAAAKAARSNPT